MALRTAVFVARGGSEHDEDLAVLRGNPRFEALLAKMRLDESSPRNERNDA